MRCAATSSGPLGFGPPARGSHNRAPELVYAVNAQRNRAIEYRKLKMPQLQIWQVLFRTDQRGRPSGLRFGDDFIGIFFCIFVMIAKKGV